MRTVFHLAVRPGRVPRNIASNDSPCNSSAGGKKCGVSLAPVAPSGITLIVIAVGQAPRRGSYGYCIISTD